MIFFTDFIVDLCQIIPICWSFLLVNVENELPNTLNHSPENFVLMAAKHFFTYSADSYQNNLFRSQFVDIGITLVLVQKFILFELVSVYTSIESTIISKID